MRCPERRASTRSFEFGSRSCLRTTGSESTVFDMIPLGRANAVRVCIVVLVLPAGAQLSIAALVTNDDENYTQYAASAINQPGVYSFLANNVAFAGMRIGVQAQGAPNLSAVFGLSAITFSI